MGTVLCGHTQRRETELPKHKSGRYTRQDPSGGQWRFWVLLALAVLVAIGWLLVQHADRLTP